MTRMIIGGFMLFLLIYWFMYTGQQLISACRPILIGVVIAYPMNIMILPTIAIAAIAASP